MYQIVHIGGQEVEMVATAAVDIYFKQAFGKDPIKMQSNKDIDNADVIWLMERMGFIMAMAAKFKDRKKMLKLNEDSYIEWADGFGRGDLINALDQIQAVYDGQKITQVEEKKDTDQ